MEALPAIQPDALEVLRRRPRREHEASFFFFDPAFSGNACRNSFRREAAILRVCELELVA